MQHTSNQELYIENWAHTYSLGNIMCDLMSEDHIRNGVSGIFLTVVCL